MRKILLQSRWWTINPPMEGPAEQPVYTVATTIPIALPLSEGGKRELKIAIHVAIIIDAPVPCIILKRISI